MNSLRDSLFYLIVLFILNVNYQPAQSQSKKTDSLKQVLKNLDKRDTNYIKTLNKLAYRTFVKSPEKTIEYAKESIQLAQDINYLKGEAGGEQVYAIGHAIQGKFSTAKTHFLKAAKIFEQINDEEGLAGAYNGLGNVTAELSQLDESIKYLNKSLILFEKIGQKNRVALLYNNIAATYDDLKNLDKAIEYYEKSVAQYKELGNEGEIARVYHNLNVAYFDKKQYAKAKDYTLKALDLWKKLDDKGEMALSYNSLGLINQKEKLYPQAIENHQKALEIMTKLKRKSGIAYSLKHLSDAYIKVKKYDEAEKNLQQTLVIAQEIKQPKAAQGAYRDLYKIDSLRGNYQRAIGYLLKSQALNRKILEDKRNKEAARLATQYETKRKDQEIAQKELTIQNKNLTLKQRNTQLAGLVGAGALLVLFAFNLYRSRKKQLKLNQVLSDQKEEIEQQTEELKATNNQLVRLDEFKQQMMSMIVHDLKNPLNSIIGLSEMGNTKSDPSFYTNINQDGQRMHHLVMNILDTQKFEDNQIQLQPTAGSIITLVDSAVQQTRLLTQNKKILVQVEGLPAHLIEADQELINRVLVNLMTNAVKYTPQGGTITIKANAIQNEGNDVLKVSVQDSGVGIAPEFVNTIFDKYQQVNHKKSGMMRSTGLGLTFCKLTIEAHNGEIGVNSIQGEGSTFWFTLPIAKMQEEGQAQIIDTQENTQQNLSFEFTKEERDFLKPVLEKIKQYEIFEVSKIKTVLTDEVDNYPSENIQRWQQEFLNSVFTDNEVVFEQLLACV